jgi:hypothetical protein
MYKGLIPRRPDDKIGVAFAYARVGDNARGLDSDIGSFGNFFYPVRSGETMIEVMYQAQWTKWWTVQPEMQYIIRPGGGVLNPGDGLRRRPTAKRVGDCISFHNQFLNRPHPANEFKIFSQIPSLRKRTKRLSSVVSCLLLSQIAPGYRPRCDHPPSRRRRRICPAIVGRDPAQCDAAWLMPRSRGPTRLGSTSPFSFSRFYSFGDSRKRVTPRRCA